MTTVDLHEAVTLAATPQPSGRMVIQVINPGWGSSGYYSAEVLESAARDRVFPAGTKCFLDHPSESERFDRPERSVKDLAAVLTEDARWTGDALVAPVQVFGPFRDVIAEMKDAIGVSIRAAAEVTEGGEAEGRTGRIVDRIVEGVSVDFVTTAGRGGRILQVLESARAKPVERAVRRGVAEATANETREQLRRPSSTPTARTRRGSGSATSTTPRSGSRSRPPTTSAPGSRRTPPPTDRHPVRRAHRGARPRPDTSRSTRPGEQRPPRSPEEDTMPQIEEARLRQLEADAGRVAALESERDTANAQRDAVARELATERARNTATTRARTRVVEANATLAPATVDRIVAQATAAVPLTVAGQLDEAALDTVTDTARTAEEAYVASLAAASGAGTVRGLGGDTQVDESVDVNAIVAGAFGRTTREV